jgi:Zn-finger nucleic acid-binding protein
MSRYTTIIIAAPACRQTWLDMTAHLFLKQKKQYQSKNYSQGRKAHHITYHKTKYNSNGYGNNADQMRFALMFFIF